MSWWIVTEGEEAPGSDNVRGSDVAKGSTAVCIHDTRRLDEVSNPNGKGARSLGDRRFGKGRGGGKWRPGTAGVATSRHGERVATKHKNVEHSMQVVK